MDRFDQPLPVYSKDQRKIEELTQQLRHLQLDSDSAITELRMQLQAEKDKSKSLEQALQEKGDTAQLLSKLHEAEEVKKKLRTDLVKLTRGSLIVADDDSSRSRLQELETENFLLTQKVKGLEKQAKDVKNSALLMVKEKETAIADLRVRCEVLITENGKLQGDMEDLKRLMNDMQKRRDDLKALNDELTAQVAAALSSQQALESSSRPAVDRLHQNEINEYLERISRLEFRLSEKDEEIAAMHRKISEAKSYKGQIFDDVAMLEENLTQMQETISSLRKQLAEKTKEIESLEYELTCARQESKGVQELMDTRRKNGEVISGLREKERFLDGELANMTAALQKAKQENRDMGTKLASMEKEKSQFADNCDRLRTQVVELTAELRLTQEKAKRVQEDTKQEMISRILSLKQEKLELQAKLEELQDQIEMQKRSFFDAPSLMDELKQLEDLGGYKPTRMSVAPVNSGLEKQLEALRMELTEKEFLLKTANGDIENLRQEIASLTQKLTQHDALCSDLRAQTAKLEDELSASIAETARLQERMLANETARIAQNRGSHGPSLQTQVDTLQAELKRLQTELLLSKEMWAEENNTLRTALLDAEKTAVEATTKYAEAAADRDTFMKKYRDLARDRDRRSTKY